MSGKNTLNGLLALAVTVAVKHGVEYGLDYIKKNPEKVKLFTLNGLNSVSNFVGNLGDNHEKKSQKILGKSNKI